MQEHFAVCASVFLDDIRVKVMCFLLRWWSSSKCDYDRSLYSSVCGDKAEKFSVVFVGALESVSLFFGSVKWIIVDFVKFHVRVMWLWSFVHRARVTWFICV